MKTRMILSEPILLLLLLAIVIPAQAQSANAQQTLDQYVAELQKNPNDSALREKIIKLAQERKPAPAIPDEAMRYFVEGNVFLKAAKTPSDYEMAINKYKQALIAAPWWGDAYNNLSIAYNAAGRRADAKQALQLYLLTNPADASQARTKIYEIGAQEQLEEEHKRQADQRGREFTQEAQQGVVDYNNQRYDAAIAHFRKSLEADPNHPQAYSAYCNLGLSYVGKKDYDNALKNLQKGLELKPDDVYCNTNMGAVLWYRNDQPGACRHYQKACNLGDQVDCNFHAAHCPR